MTATENVPMDQRTTSEWFHVNELLPEDCPICPIHEEGTMRVTTVLVMDECCRMEIRNRMKVERCGVPYLDELATDGWIWGESKLVPEWWYPIPRNDRRQARRKETKGDE